MRCRCMKVQVKEPSDRRTVCYAAANGPGIDIIQRMELKPLCKPLRVASTSEGTATAACVCIYGEMAHMKELSGAYKVFLAGRRPNEKDGAWDFVPFPLTRNNAALRVLLQREVRDFVRTACVETHALSTQNGDCRHDGVYGTGRRIPLRCPWHGGAQRRMCVRPAEECPPLHPANEQLQAGSGAECA